MRAYWITMLVCPLTPILHLVTMKQRRGKIARQIFWKLGPTMSILRRHWFFNRLFVALSLSGINFPHGNFSGGAKILRHIWFLLQLMLQFCDIKITIHAILSTSCDSIHFQ